MKIPGSVLCVVLLAGFHSVTATISYTGQVGEEHIFSLVTFFQEIASCHLKTPAGNTLDFIPGEAHNNGDKYELQSINPTMPACGVVVKNLQESDSGQWELSFKTPTSTGNSQTYRLTVVAADIQESEEDNVIQLEKIEFPTRTGQTIDISIPKTEHVEKCLIKSPGGDYIEASEFQVENVTVYGSSEFVSCRITLGPMSESLLGAWAVCGMYTENNEEHKLCQSANVYWNNANHPDNIWSTTRRPVFNYPVHFGSNLTPAVTGSGNIISCHIVTPNGEDLVIKEDSKYPGIKAETLANSLCGIVIGPIDSSMINEWTVYGIFRNSVNGLNEVRLPFSMFIYDEENPYNQAYNVTILNPVNRIVHLGNTLNLDVNINAGQVDNCYFEPPSGNIYDMNKSNNVEGVSFFNDNNMACKVALGPITEKMLGEWKLTGKFSNNGIFTEQQQTFHIILEDPENPIEENRIVTELSAQMVTTKIGDAHRFIINTDPFIQAESCHIRTPDGLQYKIMESFNLPNVEVIKDSGVECGVIVNVNSEDAVGEWTLIARATRFSQAIERRLPFTIYAEEFVETLENDISIAEGNSLMIRLKYPTTQYSTCKLYGPQGIETVAEHDDFHVDTCGFIRRNVDISHSGTWTIMYGSRIAYKAEVLVTVIPIDSEAETSYTLNLIQDRTVNKVVGPEHAVYCKLEDPTGFTVFEGFGTCNLTLDKVGLEHKGTWHMLVGTLGKVLTHKYDLHVYVTESEGKAVVKTHVEKQQPVVIISCAVETEAEVTGCKFRDPQGNILLATAGVSEDRYAFHSNVSFQSEVKSHECGIRISNPLVSELGLWRCAIDTTEDTYFGHLAVLCPWALSDPDIAATVQQEPLLTSDRSIVSVVEEEPATMSCSVQAAIRYCYFRAANGTTFTVSPGMSASTMEYSGAGFDAGECGIRFHGMHALDSGSWTCHVGLVSNHIEQRDQIQLTVQERMVVNHLQEGNVMKVEGLVYEQRALEYCRFVRIDGFGFTTDSVPSEYTVTGVLANGECRFTAQNPSILELHPWTVVAKIRGQDIEIAKDTMNAILISPPTPPPDNDGPVFIYRTSGLTIFLYVLLIILLVTIIMGIMVGPKRHREWAANQASSFRRSFTKKPLRPEADLPPKYDDSV